MTLGARRLPKRRSVHSLATLFPVMSGQAFEELTSDIRANGLREHNRAR